MLLRVCFFSPYSYYFFSNGKCGRVGGTELDLYLVGKYLSKDPNFSVSFIVADFGQRIEEHCGNIRIFRSFRLSGKLSDAFHALFQIFQSFRKANADVYVCSTAGAEVGIIFFLCKIFGKKFVYRTAHDMDCNRDYARKHRFFGTLFEIGMIGADRILTSVKIHGEMLQKTYGKKIKNRTFVPYGMERNPSEIGKVGGYILWVARGEKWKNPQFFLELAEKFPMQKFLMIMPKKEEEGDFFESIKERALKIKNLDFFEGVPFMEVQRFFNNAKIFVNTSEYEGFTFTLLQSGIANIPVVYFKVNPDNIISEHGPGYCADGDFEKMRGFLEKLISNEDDLKEKSRNISEYISKNHDIEKNISFWKEIFFDLVKKGK